MRPLWKQLPDIFHRESLQDGANQSVLAPKNPAGHTCMFNASLQREILNIFHDLELRERLCPSALGWLEHLHRGVAKWCTPHLLVLNSVSITAILYLLLSFTLVTFVAL